MGLLVLDFGGTSLKYALMNDKLDFLDRGILQAPRNCEDEFYSTIEKLYEKYSKNIDGLAISFAGRIDSETGFVYHGGNYSFIHEENLAKKLSRLFECPVSIMNDAECALLGEFKHGNLIGVNDAMGIIIGTAIGGSLLIDGEIYHGNHLNAGELSSIIVDPKDSRLTRLLFGHNTHTALTNNYAKHVGINKEGLNGKIFFENLDNEKLVVLENFSRNLANQIYNFQCILDLEKVLIGGGISQQPILIEMIQESVNNVFNSMHQFRVVPVEVVACKYGNDANLIGAVENYHNKLQ